MFAFYLVALFFFVISLTLCQFRLIFVDPQLLRIYEVKYSQLTGLLHYLPGKYEVFLVGLVFVPIWAIHFLFSTNLNVFFEDRTLEEKEEEENAELTDRKSSVQVDTNFEPKSSGVQESYSKVSGYRKKVILLNTWSTLPFSKKVVRQVIVWFPILVLLAINLTVQYTVAIAVDQVNFNLLNVGGNLLMMYFMVFHFAVFMPLMFLRSNSLLKGDYLWNPFCNFIVENNPRLDISGLQGAIDDYDEHYLTLLANGQDPNEKRENFDIENGKMFWKKSKLGDLVQKKDENYFSVSDDEDIIDPNRAPSKSKISPFTVKYTTFDPKDQSLPVHKDSEEIRDDQSKQTIQTVKTENSVWSDEVPLTPEPEKKVDEEGALSPGNNLMNANDFSDEEKLTEELDQENEKKPSSEEFEKVSPERAETGLNKDDLDDYFTDIDNNVKAEDSGKNKDAPDASPILSENEEQNYFDMETDRNIDPNKKIK